MQLVALFCQDSELGDLFGQLDLPGVVIHKIPAGRPLPKLIGALELLHFAGALALERPLQTQIFACLERASLDARNAEAVDAVTVTAAGPIGDYTLGRTLGSALQSEGWDVRGARAVIFGSGSPAKSMAQELVGRGAEHLTVLASDRPAAERTLPELVGTGQTEARAASESLVTPLLEQADILLRTDPELDVDVNLLGPHLTIVDLAPSPLSDLRKAALMVGAKSLGLRDLQAHQTALALSHILARRLEVEPFLSLFHAQEV